MPEQKISYGLNPSSLKIEQHNNSHAPRNDLIPCQPYRGDAGRAVAMASPLLSRATRATRVRARVAGTKAAPMP